MKRIIYILLIAFTSSLAISSCTEETVTPKNEADNLGGTGTDPKI